MRYLLLDRITALEAQRATAVKCVSLADDVFVDHFPGQPVMPGALIVESLAQLGGALAEAAMRRSGRGDLYALLTMIQRARFRQVVRPGDRMELEARLASVSEDGALVSGGASVDGRLVAEAELGFAFTSITSEKLIARRREILDIWLSGAAPAEP